MPNLPASPPIGYAEPDIRDSASARPAPSPRQEGASVYTILTAHQHSVLLMAAQGMPGRRISIRLGVTHGTVRLTLFRIRHILGASNTTHAVALAMARGILNANEITKM